MFFYNQINDEIFFRYREDLCNLPDQVKKNLHFNLYDNQLSIKTNQYSLIVLNNWTMAHGRTIENFLGNNMDRIAYRTLVI